MAYRRDAAEQCRKRTVTVTPSLRLTDGSEVALPAVSIASGTVESIDLHESLMQSHPEIMSLSSPYGSVVLRYSAASNASLYPAAMVHYDGRPIIFHWDGSQPG